MPLVVGCLALAFPRVALALVYVLGGDYVTRPFDDTLYPILGFIFFPLMTLAFVFAMNSLGGPGEVDPLGWVLIGIAGLCDVGLIGQGNKSRKKS